ncbi:hypothetical protein [Rubritalea profundi]|uniref:GspL periplasmic domain-containing protein n=1 Tax=Rubritalea profundi TaxID=1658618 RepID=A0A2S7U4T7_9BACT|nr:hypothetical protein [Rubritalea profundi]PQJ30029.1 hypothetical protein BSZ32_17110 [Rubritalea profundi]
MKTKLKQDLSLVALDTKPLLVIVQQENYYSALIVKSGAVVAFIQVVDDVFSQSMEKILEALKQQKNPIPKRLLVVSSDARETVLAAPLENIEDKQQLERAIQFAASDVVESLFDKQDPEVCCVIEDRLTETDFTELISVLPELSPTGSLKQTVKGLGFWDSSTPVSTHLVKSVGDVSIAIKEIEHDQVLTSFLPLDSLAMWGDFLEKNKLVLLGIVSEQVLARSESTGSCAYLESHSASLLHWKSGKIENFTEFTRLGIDPPSGWLSQVSGIDDESVRVVASDADKYVLNKHSIDVSSARFSEEFIAAGVLAALDGLRLVPVDRDFNVHRVSSIPEVWFKSRKTWIVLASVCALCSAAAMVVPNYIKIQEQTIELEELVAKIDYINADLAKIDGEKEMIEKVNKEIKKYKVTTSSKGGNTVPFPFLADHKAFLDTVSKSVGASGSSIELKAFSSDWNGKLMLNGKANNLMEARGFTDEFAKLLAERDLPEHIAEVEEDAKEETYTFIIKPNG